MPSFSLAIPASSAATQQGWPWLGLALDAGERRPDGNLSFGELASSGETPSWPFCKVRVP